MAVAGTTSAAGSGGRLSAVLTYMPGRSARSGLAKPCTAMLRLSSATRGSIAVTRAVNTRPGQASEVTRSSLPSRSLASSCRGTEKST